MLPAMRIVDLRSDTVTRPSTAMRAAMAAADVGDDCYRDDPTALELEAKVAELFGKEAALFVPSGTMANQIALMLHCRPGDEVIIGEGAHCYFYEGGAGGAFAGVQFVEAGKGGLYDRSDLEAALKPSAYYLPRTRLVCFENTHNRAGGRVFPQETLVEIAEAARARGLATHLDGARIWNAATATGLSLDALVAPVDTVSVCFSKGLGAPMGSALLGSKDTIAEALRYRRMFGGALRQSGIVCAAALYALEHHRQRMQQDHDRALELAKGLSTIAGLECVVESVETNIVQFRVVAGDAPAFVERAAAAGVMLGALDDYRIRAVTHLDLGESCVANGLERLAQVAASGA